MIEINASLDPNKIKQISQTIGKNLKKFNGSIVSPYEFIPFA